MMRHIKIAILALVASSLLAAPYRTTKSPGSSEDFTVDWSRVAASNAIASSTWSVPAGLSTVSTGNTTTRAMIRLAGGSLRNQYTVRNTVTLADGQVLEQSIIVEIEQQ